MEAHWKSRSGMEVLLVLSKEYRIVPRRNLREFLAHCQKDGYGMMDFLHPCSLFDDYELAADVYKYLGNLGPTVPLLTVLRYLGGSERSNAHGWQLWPMLHMGIRVAAERVTQTHMLCSLAFRYFSVEQMALVDLRGVGEMALRSRTTNAALHLMARMTVAQHAKLARPLAFAAHTGYARAMYYLTALGRDPAHAIQVADAVQCYGYCAYMDRLNLNVLWRTVPFLVKNRANAALLRLACHDGRHAIEEGVFTAMIADSRPVPQLPPPKDPGTIHSAVHYVYMYHQLPPKRHIVDAAMWSNAFSPMSALLKISRNCAPLRLYMVMARKWQRRRVDLVEMVRGHSSCAIMAQLKCHEFAWRLVFSYI